MARKSTRFSGPFVPAQAGKPVVVDLKPATLAARREVLSGFVPGGVEAWVAKALDDEVVSAYIHRPGEHARKEYRKDFGVFFRAAVFDHDTYGELDLRRAMRDDRIAAYLDSNMLSTENGTAATLRCTLQDVRRHAFPDLAPARRRISRPKIDPPYTRPYVMTLWTAAERLFTAAGGHEPTASKRKELCARYRLLLALSAGAGARTGEIERLLVADVMHTVAHGQTYFSLRLVDFKGRARLVPLGGFFGDYIVASIVGRDPRSLLFWPEKKNPRRRVEETVNQVHQRIKFAERYKPSRGRALWLTELLAKPVAFFEVMPVAGIGVGTHTANDLLLYASPPEQHSADLLKAVQAQ